MKKTLVALMLLASISLTADSFLRSAKIVTVAVITNDPKVASHLVTLYPSDLVLVAASGIAEFAGQDGQIAHTVHGKWKFTPMPEGTLIFSQNRNELLVAFSSNDLPVNLALENNGLTQANNTTGVSVDFTFKFQSQQRHSEVFVESVHPLRLIIPQAPPGYSYTFWQTSNGIATIHVENNGTINGQDSISTRSKFDSVFILSKRKGEYLAHYWLAPGQDGVFSDSFESGNTSTWR